MFQAHTKEMEEKYGETIMEERKILTPQSVQQDLDALGQYKTAEADPPLCQGTGGRSSPSGTYFDGAAVSSDLLLCKLTAN